MKIHCPSSNYILVLDNGDSFTIDKYTVEVVERLNEVGMEAEAAKFLVADHFCFNKKTAKEFVKLFAEDML